MSKLQRMIVIPLELFEKWKTIIAEDGKLSSLDKNMKDILYNSKMSDYDKWQLYRDNLIRYKSARQKDPIQRATVATNTRRIPRAVNASSQTTNIHQIPYDATRQTTNTQKIQYDTATQTTDLFDNFIPPGREEIEPVVLDHRVSTIPKEIYYQSAQNTSHTFANTTPEEEEFDRDESIRELALAGTPPSTRIVMERPSQDPSEYRVFELSTGDVVTVPVPQEPPIRPNTRSWLQRQKNESQTKIDFPKRRLPKRPKAKNTSTPEKQQRTVDWEPYR